MSSKLLLSLLTNSDDVHLFWRPADNASLAGCVGFAIEREITGAAAKTRAYLDNRTGFADQPGKPGEHRPSNVWPFQRFSWTDHEASTGDLVSYRVLPVVSAAGNQLSVDMTRASDWSTPITLGADAGQGISMYFNRGLVMSQFMSRHLAELQKTKKLTFNQALAFFKKQEIQTDHSTIRDFLGGELKKAAVKLLADAKTSNGQIYAALFELADPEILAGLKALGARAHVLLADGAGDAAKPWADENAEARTALKAAGVDVQDRFTRFRSAGAKGGKPLAHNKFIVLADAGGNPVAVWTGSTNLTATGFCTQINNALLIADAECAKAYFAQWQVLVAAKNAYPATLIASNSKFRTVASINADVWFTRTGKGEDMDALRQLVQSASSGVLFLMFMPGPSGLYKTITDLVAQKPGLLVHGVVSTLPTPASNDQATVTLHGAAAPAQAKKPFALDIVQPEGIDKGFASWLDIVSRGLFTSQVGHAIIHSKLVVIDPLTNPIVITGSHNFSGAASNANDENFVVVRGNKQLARAYSAHIYSVYDHYRWLKYVNQTQAAGQQPWAGLVRDDSWQAGRLTGASLNELKFWVPNAN